VGVIDTASDRVERVVEGLGLRPWGIVATRDKVLTANGPSNDVSVIDVASWKVRAIPVGRSPWGVALGTTR
jgi:YVTN family beta-propeller protein